MLTLPLVHVAVTGGKLSMIRSCVVMPGNACQTSPQTYLTAELQQQLPQASQTLLFPTPAHVTRDNSNTHRPE